MAHHQPSEFPIISRVRPTPFHLITNAAALRLRYFLRYGFLSHRHHLGLLLRSSFQNISRAGHDLRIEQLRRGRSIQFNYFNLLQWSCDSWATTCTSCLCFFSGKESRSTSGDNGMSHLGSTTRRTTGRQWTNVILAVNVLVYLAQLATHGRLMLWGAKINSLIDKGQLWRLATSALLHANIGHLMINCYSLNSIGPTIENLSGPRRYLAIYMTSAIASSTMSYWCSKSPAVGASGAIFGLVGSYAMFVLRHNSLVKGGVGDLQHVARVIALNMAIGLLTQGIDNWGHLGGLIGGVAISWLIGPAWKYEAQSAGGRRVLVDRAPIFTLTRRNRASR